MNFVWWILITGFHQAGDPAGVWTFNKPELFRTHAECVAVAQTTVTDRTADQTGNWWCEPMTLTTSANSSNGTED